MKTLNSRGKTIPVIVFLCMSVCGTAQISTPGASVNTSSNNNIGIGTNSPNSRLQINSDGTTGLLQLNYSETQGAAGNGAGGGGGSSTVTPTYAFELINTPLNLAGYSTFKILGSGKTYIGDFSGISGANAKLNIRNSVRLFYNTDNAVKLFSALNKTGLVWDSPSASSFVFNANGTELMTLNSDGQLGIGTDQFTGTERLHVSGNSEFDGQLIVNKIGIGVSNVNGLLHTYKYDVTNTGNLGQNHGLTIENNGWRGHDYSLEVKTGKGQVFTIANSGHVFIGEGLSLEAPQPTEYRLYVEKGIRTEYLKVDVASENQWADFVFDQGYSLMSIDELEEFVFQHNHLPNMPSAKEVVENGVNVVEMNKLLLQNIEELTLRMIEMKKEIAELKRMMR